MKDTCQGAKNKHNDKFQMNMRIYMTHNSINYDLASIGFAKNGDIEKRRTSDLTDTIIEGKCILDNIVKAASLNFEEAKKIKVYNIKFCGNICDML